MNNKAEDALDRMIDKALKKGADAADAVFIESDSVSVLRRKGEPEGLERSEEADIGLRVFMGQKQAFVSTTDMNPDSLDNLIDHAIAMVKQVPEDQYSGLADPELFSKEWENIDLDLHDPVEPDVETLIAMADEAEAAALKTKGITNSEGAEAGWSNHVLGLRTSKGFSGSYATTGHSLYVSVLAGEGTKCERDYDYTTASHAEDLDDPVKIGEKAAERALARLNPKKGATKKVPVVFDPRISASILRSFSRVASGGSVARGTSFLKDRMGEQIFAEGITLIDDPFVRRGKRSKPFDAEGVAPQKRNLVENGVLQGWVLSLRSAAQLGLQTTGNAARGLTSPPSPSVHNFYMLPGDLSPEALIGEIEEGFYVTEVMGMGNNLITGDYSQGASGFWIENGVITYPVSEMTIAGNHKDMWMNLTPANNLEHKYGIDVPTLRIDGMMVAGS